MKTEQTIRADEKGTRRGRKRKGSLLTFDRFVLHSSLMRLQ